MYFLEEVNSQYSVMFGMFCSWVARGNLAGYIFVGPKIKKQWGSETQIRTSNDMDSR